MLTSAILAAVSLCWAAQVSAEQVTATSGAQVSAETETSLDPASQAPQPQEDPEGTVRELYADETFFYLRNTFPPAMVQRFSCCFTPELVRHFESYNQEVDRWIDEHRGEDLKLPTSEGPIFLSNYEGADTFSVGEAQIDGSHAEVPVSFSYTYGTDTFQWIDIVMLRLVDGVWLMDDIQFDPERWDDYTLRKRVALDE